MAMKKRFKWLYGIASIGEAGLYGIIGTFALFFLTTVVGINPAIAGTITAIGAVWETVCGAVIGYVSDNTYTKYGKRKPFILAASIPLMVFTALFFTCIYSQSGLLPVYYGFMLVMFWTCFSTFYVPYLAWGAELTQDYDERTALRGYAYFFSTIGMAIGLVLPNITVELLMDRGMSIETGWAVTGISCGIICGLTIFIGAAGIKDRYEISYSAGRSENTKNKKEKKSLSTSDIINSLISNIKNMIVNYLQILKMKTARCIIGASICYLIAYAMFCSVRMYYFTYNMGLSSGVITVIMLFLTFAAVAFVPLIWALCKRFDKRTAFIIGMCICAILMGGLGFVGIDSVFDIIVFTVAYSIGSIAYWQLVPSMIYDVCEVDELVNNKRRGGLVISLQSLSESIANAVGLQLVGLILNFSGFDGSVAIQSKSALTCINMTFSVLPAVFMALSIICIIKYPVSKKVYLKVVDAIKIRAEGGTVEMEQFNKLK